MGVGTLPGADMDTELVNGGNWKSYGGGGTLSVAVGELELLRNIEFNEGENNPLGGNRLFKDPWP